jgi:DNA-binding IscR family transcriptional regulator
MADILRAVRGALPEMFGFDAHPTGDDIPAAVWGDVRARLTEVLEHTTLQDFVTRAETTGIKRAAVPSTMYFI